MSFLSPVFLLGLPLIAVPLLIHFFNRKQREPIRWGAMELLLAAPLRRRRFMRWRDLLLLLLRLAIVLAIVGALAQPMVTSTLVGAAGPRDVILVVDNSMSTARRLGGGPVFDRELAEADRILRQLKGTDMLRILLASPAPEWLGDAPVAGGSGALNELAARLRRVKPNDGAADMLSCVQTALQAEPAGQDMARVVTVVTDGQEHGWRAATPGAWASIHALAGQSGRPVAIRVVIPDGAAQPAANLAIEKITAVRSVVAAGQPAMLTASVKNTGDTPSAATSLAWSTREESLGVSGIPALQPGVGTTVSLNQSFATPGLTEITGKLAGQDDLAPDNSARFLLEVTQSVPVLIVEGEPQADPLQSDSRYFLAALGYSETGEAMAAASIFRPKLINYERLGAEELSRYQAIVLADVPRLPDGVAQKLARYVNAGGGLWVALGEQTDVAAFNQAFYEQNAGLSALPLLQPVGDADNREKSINLTPPSADHPATALLADTRRLDIDRVRIYRRHQFDIDSSSAGPVLLRAEGGAPVAVERDLGRGRVIVLGIPLGLAWSNLPLCHSYVVMAREWLWYLTEPGLVKRNLSAGEVLQVTAPVESSSGSATLETPAGRLAQLFGQEEDGRLLFRFPKTQAPGMYQLTLADAAAGAHPEKFLVSRDPEESDLTLLSPEQMKKLSAAGGLEFGGNPLFQPATQKITAPPRPLAAWLLLTLIGLMLAEIVVAFWLARRRRIVKHNVALEPILRA